MPKRPSAADPVKAELEYWRDRATELERLLAEARTRLLALAESLPPPRLLDLIRPTASIRTSKTTPGSPVVGLSCEPASLQPSDVETELRRLWEALGRGRESRG